MVSQHLHYGVLMTRSQASLPAFPEARRLVEQHAAGVPPGRSELVPLLRSRGRVLAEDIITDSNIPTLNNTKREC